MDVRRTVSQTSSVRLEVKKSVFIALVSPIDHPEEAGIFVEGIRRRYPDASHHVYAWKTTRPSIMQKYSDDNEPSGTAGLPIMEMISRQELSDLVIVVVRYFGGVKLGTGGLQRAYVQSAEQALLLAKPVEWIVAFQYRVTVSYAQVDSLKYMFINEGVEILGISYEARVIFEIICPVYTNDTITKAILDVTSGQAEIVFLSKSEMKRAKGTEE